MASKVLSIEIGTNLTHIVEMDYKTKKPKIYKAFCFATPADMVNEGVVKINGLFGSFLSGKLKEQKITTNKVMFVLNSSRIASREVDFPNVKESKIQSLIYANASEYFPVDLSQYQLIHDIVGHVEEGDIKRTKVSVIAVPQEILDSYNMLALECGFTIIGFDYVGNAVKQLMKREIPEEIKVSVKVDETASILTVMEGEEVKLQRSINYGIGESIEEIQDSELFGEFLSFSEAMDVARMKTCMFLHFDQMSGGEAETDVTGREIDPIKLAKLRTRVTYGLQSLIGGIERVLDYYRSRNTEKVIESIYLTGIGMDFSGLSKLMTNELNCKVVALQNFENIQIDKNLGMQNYKLSEYFSCIGATLEPLPIFDDGKKKKSAKKKVTDENGNELPGAAENGSFLIPAAVCGVCVLLGVVLVAIPTFKNMSIEKNNASLRGAISDLSYAQQVFDEYNVTTATYNGVTMMEEATITYNNKLARIIEEFEKKMPSQIRVLSLSASENAVNLSITVDSKSVVADVIMQLRTFESIEVGSISTITDSKDETGQRNVSFSVDCGYIDTSLAETEEAAEGSIADAAAAAGESTDQATTDLENSSDEAAGVQ